MSAEQLDHAESGRGLILGGNLVLSKSYRMFSGMNEAQEVGRRYFLYKGKSGKRWVVSATDENCGEYIYVDGGKGSQGFGGAILRFNLAPIGCGYVEFEGPWHSNADALFKDTEIDVRDKFFTWGAIAKRRIFDPNRNERSSMPYILEDLLYFDERPILGTYDRIDVLAEKLSLEHGKQVVVYCESRGGSSCGYHTPKGEDWRTYPKFDGEHY